MTAASADLTALARDLSAASRMGIQAAAARVVGETAQRVQAIAQAKAPFRTGKLRTSIGIRQDSPFQAQIGPSVVYGPYQEFGTGSRGEFGGAPYEIRPKKPNGLLVFQVDGRTVFARKVTHPGVPPHPYMRPAAVEALGPAAGELAAAGALLITRGQR